MDSDTFISRVYGVDVREDHTRDKAWRIWVKIYNGQWYKTSKTLVYTFSNLLRMFCVAGRLLGQMANIKEDGEGEYYADVEVNNE